MQLSFRDVKKAFEIEEKTLYQWINNREMPAVKANDQYYFNSVEILEWALKYHIQLTPGALKLCEKLRPGQSLFSRSLMRGGVHFNIGGSCREEALENVLDFLPLPGNVQRSFFKEMLLSRDQAGTTGIGNGIAIPHVKHPVVLAGMEPVVGLFFMEKSVDFAAFDNLPVHTLFVILSGSFKEHLSLLSRLAFCLQDEKIKSALERHASREEIIAAFQVVESRTDRPL